MTKITNLEKFALEQIFRPYQNMLDFGEKRLDKLPMKIDEIPSFIEAHPEWWGMVKDRILRCKFYFPNYIQHKLLSYLRK